MYGHTGIRWEFFYKRYRIYGVKEYAVFLYIRFGPTLHTSHADKSLVCWPMH